MVALKGIWLPHMEITVSPCETGKKCDVNKRRKNPIPIFLFRCVLHMQGFFE